MPARETCNFCRNCLEIDGCDNWPNKGHCPVDWRPTYRCIECGDVEVAHDGLDCTECKAKFIRQQKSMNGVIAMLFGRRVA